MIKIGDFSKLSRISIRMLRHYDDIGLLKPVSVDRFTGYRYYSTAQLSDAARIAMLKNMGFSLALISEIIKNYSDTETLKQYLQIKYAEAQQELETAQDRLRLIETAINRLGKDENAMKYNVNIKEMPQRYVASLRRIIPSYDKEGLLWKQLYEEAAAFGIKLEFANPRDTLAVFHDKDFREYDVDVEIQATVTGSYKNTENIVFKTTAPILIASAVYKGSYDMITEAHKAVADWVTDNGYEFNGAMFCIYHVSPACESNPDNLVTEVCFPVRKIQNLT